MNSTIFVKKNYNNFNRTEYNTKFKRETVKIKIKTFKKKCHDLSFAIFLSIN